MTNNQDIRTYTSRKCDRQFTINPQTDLLFMDDLFGDQNTKFCYCDKCEYNHTFYLTENESEYSRFEKLVSRLRK